MTTSTHTDGAKTQNKRNGERGSANSLPRGILFGALAGFAAQAAVIAVSAFVLSGLEDPAVGFDICAVLSSVASGIFAGKTAASKNKSRNGILCGIGSAGIMAAVLIVLSCVFVPEAFTAWVPYTCLGVMFALSAFTAGKDKKERKRNAKTAVKRRRNKFDN